MKYVCLLAFFTCGYFNLGFCQPILTGASSNPVGGDKFFLHYSGNQANENKSPGPGGANVLWDHSDLLSNVIDSISYSSCEGMPSCDLFPGSNLYWPVSGSGYAFYSYYIANNDSFSFVGYIDTAITYNYISQHWDTSIQITNADYDGTTMHYPFTNNSNFIINFMTQTTATPDTYYRYGSESFTGDAYGTLILPSGTFNNVLRVHETFLGTDSQIVNGIASASHVHEEYYYWYMPNFHHWLLSIELKFYSAPSTEIDTFVTYVTDGSTEGVAGQRLEKPYLTVYPNPVQNELVLESKENGMTINIYNLLGQLQYKAIVGQNKTIISTKDFVMGVYFVQVIYSDGGMEVRKVVKE